MTKTVFWGLMLYTCRGFSGDDTAGLSSRLSGFINGRPRVPQEDLGEFIKTYLGVYMWIACQSAHQTCICFFSGGFRISQLAWQKFIEPCLPTTKPRLFCQSELGLGVENPANLGTATNVLNSSFEARSCLNDTSHPKFLQVFQCLHPGSAYHSKPPTEWVLIRVSRASIGSKSSFLLKIPM